MNSANSIEVYIIWLIFCNFFFIIYEKVFPVFPIACSNNLIYIDITTFCFTTRSCSTTTRRKINNFIHNRDIFNPSAHCIYGSSFKQCSESNNELVCGQPLMLVMPGNIFLKTCYNTQSLILICSIFKLIQLEVSLFRSVSVPPVKIKAIQNHIILNNLIALSL